MRMIIKLEDSDKQIRVIKWLRFDNIYITYHLTRKKKFREINAPCFIIWRKKPQNVCHLTLSFCYCIQIFSSTKISPTVLQLHGDRDSLFVITERADWQTKCARHKVFVSVLLTTFVPVFLCSRYQSSSAGNVSGDVYRLSCRMSVTFIRLATNCGYFDTSSQYEMYHKYPFSDFVSCSQTNWDRHMSNFLTARQKKCNLLSSVLEIVNKSLYVHRGVI
jgi:hypothetical protein